MAEKTKTSEQGLKEIRAEEIRAAEFGEVQLMVVLVRDYVSSRGRGSKGELAAAVGVSPQWVSDLLSDDPDKVPKSTSWARFKAVMEATGDVSVSEILLNWIPREEVRQARRSRKYSPAIPGSRVLTPLEREVLKALSDVPKETLQNVVHQLRGLRAARSDKRGHRPCRRCGAQVSDEEIRTNRPVGICGACARVALDIPRDIAPAGR